MLPFHHQSESILSHRPQLKISDSYQQLPYIDRALGKDDSVVLAIFADFTSLSPEL
jgi:hypothetical protein